MVPIYTGLIYNECLMIYESCFFPPLYLKPFCLNALDLFIPLSRFLRVAFIYMFSVINQPQNCYNGCPMNPGGFKVCVKLGKHTLVHYRSWVIIFFFLMCIPFCNHLTLTSHFLHIES